MLKTYTMLTKPGIIFGNAMTTAAGFALASQGTLDVNLLMITLMGLSLVIASAGVFNNYIDRAIDAKMLRTKERPLAKGSISHERALCFAFILGILGIGMLSIFTNEITVLTTLIGYFVYLVLYVYFKYRSFYGTIVGSIAGAVPPVVGYCAVSNRFDLAALILFVILVLWQMPHFFAIALYRMEDYAAAKIPVMPLQKGVQVTKNQMPLYIAAFILASLSLTLFGYTGYLSAVVTLLLGSIWLMLSLYGFKSCETHRWSRQMFVCSLVVIMGLCVTIFLEFSPVFS